MTESEVIQEFACWLAGWPDSPARRWVEENMPSLADAARVLERYELAA